MKSVPLVVKSASGSKLVVVLVGSGKLSILKMSAFWREVVSRARVKVRAKVKVAVSL